MRIYEFTNAEDALELWNLVNDSMWLALNKQQEVQAQKPMAMPLKKEVQSKQKKGKGKGSNKALRLRMPPAPAKPKVMKQPQPLSPPTKGRLKQKQMNAPLQSVKSAHQVNAAPSAIKPLPPTVAAANSQLPPVSASKPLQQPNAYPLQPKQQLAIKQRRL